MRKFVAGLMVAAAFTVQPALADEATFVEKCVSAAEAAGQPGDKAKVICECMAEKADGNSDILSSLTEAAKKPPEEREAALTPEAKVIRDACRPS